MRKMRIAICDRNPEDAQFYEKLCEQLSASYSIPAELKSYDSENRLLFDLESPVFLKKLDVVFLGVLSEKSINVAGEMRKMGYNGLIIAMGTENTKLRYEKLFDYDVFNFIRKGTNQENLARLAHIFKRAAYTIDEANAHKITLSYAGEMRQIRIDDIIYFKKEDRGVIAYYGEGEEFYFISSVAKIENQMKGRGFFRCAISYLISLNAVEEFTAKGVLMSNGDRIPLGRKYYAKLKEVMSEWVLK